MQRKLFGLLAATVLAVGMAAPAAAGTYNAGDSSADVTIGSLPPIEIDSNPSGSVTVSGGVVTEQPGVFQTAGSVGTANFTGVPTLSNVQYTVTKPGTEFGSATFQSGFSTSNPIGGGNLTGVGGAAALGGQLVVSAFGGSLTVPVNPSNVGAGGTTSVSALGGGITGNVTGAPWVTGDAQVTGLTTTLPNGAVVNTVTNTRGGLTRNGSDITVGQISGGESTNLTLVSPFRVNINVLGSLPGFAVQTLHFVPEPGTLLLLGSGVAGLAVLGRRRMNG